MNYREEIEKATYLDEISDIDARIIKYIMKYMIDGKIPERGLCPEFDSLYDDRVACNEKERQLIREYRESHPNTGPVSSFFNLCKNKPAIMIDKPAKLDTTYEPIKKKR